MDSYITIIALFGFASLCMAVMPAVTKKTGISYSVLYLLAGFILYFAFPDFFPDPNPLKYNDATMKLAEMVVIISLMGTGIKIDQPFTFKRWSIPIRLASVTMILCIAVSASLGHFMLGFDWTTAILLGAVLAPTDPVLASDVQVGPPKDHTASETQFALTGEAGLNDGMAFPFTWLAIILAVSVGNMEDALLSWAAYHVVYKIAAGIILGYLFGKLAGYLIFRVAQQNKWLNKKDGFLAISLTLVVYGLTEMLYGYGFLAVFVCAINLRHFEKNSSYHDELHSFTDQTERLLVALVLLLFGGSLANGILEPLNLSMVLFSLLFLFLIRPVSAYAIQIKAKLPALEKFAISFFGIRGIGSIFYLAFAFKEHDFSNKPELWAIVAFIILGSIVVHGLSATSVMKRL